MNKLLLVLRIVLLAATIAYSVLLFLVFISFYPYFSDSFTYTFSYWIISVDIFLACFHSVKVLLARSTCSISVIISKVVVFSLGTFVLALYKERMTDDFFIICVIPLLTALLFCFFEIIILKRRSC